MRLIDLLRSGDHSPRFHGNGFTQLYLAEDIRLHVWHPSLKPIRDHNAMIHNHRYDVKSKVYAGRLIHTVYDLVEPTEKRPANCRIIQLTGASDTDRKKPGEFTGTERRKVVRHHYEFAPGSTYTFRHPHFHSSECHCPTVTVFRRSNKRDTFAQILCGLDVDQPTHAFAPENQPTASTMWQAIEHGIGLADDRLESDVRYYRALA